ncbi:unnamed protein product, partial [Ectocarpus sp. 8 AP-2014]
SDGLQGLAAENLPISWVVTARRIASLPSCPKAVTVCIHILAAEIRRSEAHIEPAEKSARPTCMYVDEDELRWCLDLVSML